MSDEYLSLDKFKKKNSKSAVKTRKFGAALGGFGKKSAALVGSVSKKAYGAAKSDKAKKFYKETGSAAKKGFDWYTGTNSKPKTVTKKKNKRSSRRAGTVINVYTGAPPKTKNQRTKKKEDSWLGL